MSEPPFLQRLKERKFVQWALAYLAAAFVVFQLLDALAEPLGLSPHVQRSILVVVVAGFFITLILAWYHGEKGRQRVSGPELLILTGLIACTFVGIRMVGRGPTDVDTGVVGELPVDERSVAVLPLDNLSPAGEYAFFADAMTEEITSALTEVPELTVKSRTSAAKFAESGMTVAEFSQHLGVAHVIEGSVQRSEDRVRITVQLIDARGDVTVWGETYERRLIDLFDLQVEVARQVADRLAASFTDRERERILAAATDDPLAYDRYLQVSASQTDLDTEIQLLSDALERDPTFWPAWERLAFRYLDKEARGDGAQWADSSRAAFLRAIQTADHRPTELRLEAYRAMIFEGDEEEAIARLRAVAEERPSDVSLASSLGELYRIRGRLPEALRWRRQAALLDPLEADRWRQLFQIYWWLGLYDESEKALLRAVQIDPQNPGVWQQFSWQWMIQGRFDEALAAADSAFSLDPGSTAFDGALVQWWAGDFQAAVDTYEARTASAFPDPPEWQLFPMAHAHFTVGDSAEGRRLMERVRSILESRVIEDYEPEWRVFPRLQRAAIENDVNRALDLFRLYVERGGRDPNWFRQSPLFAKLRDEPAFQEELAQLEGMVADMRRRVVRELGTQNLPANTSGPDADLIRQ
jgi:TolB-like protein/Flp pilus assembly protein TadD